MTGNQTCYLGSRYKQVHPSWESVWYNTQEASDPLNYIAEKPSLRVHKDVHGSTVYSTKFRNDTQNHPIGKNPKN